MMGSLRRYIRLPHARFGCSVIHPVKCKLRNRGYVTFTKKYPAKNYLQQYEIRSTSLHVKSYALNETVDDDLVLLVNSMNRGRVPHDKLNKSISYFEENENIELDEDTRVLLLNCCGNLLPDVTLEERQKLTDRVWELINKKSNDITLRCYHALLQTYAENLHVMNPNEFIKSMKIKPDENTYRHLLRVVAKQGNLKLATDILNQIKEQEFPLTEDIFNLLVEAQSVEGNVAGALETITSMQENGLKPSLETYTLLACAYAKKGDISNILEILEKNELDAKSIMQIVKSLSDSENGKYIPQIVQFSIFPLNGSESVIMNTIIELTYKNKCADAYRIINDTPVLQENNATLIQCADCLLEHMIITDRPFCEIIEIVNSFVESGKYPEALLKVAEMSVYQSKVELAPLMFEEMKKQNLPVRPHYYWPLFMAGYREEGEKKVFSLIEHMVSINVCFDHDTICDYILPYINSVEPLAVFKKLRDYADSMSMPSYEVLTAVLSFLLSQGRLEEYMFLKERIKGNIIYNNIVDPLTKAYKITKDIGCCLTLCLKDEKNSTDIVEEFLVKLFTYNNVVTTATEAQQILEELQKNRISIPLDTSKLIKYRIYKMNFDIQDTEKVIKLLDDLTSRNISVPFLLENTRNSDTTKNYDEPQTAGKYITHPNNMTTNELACHFVELKHKGLNTKGVLRKLLIAYCKENKLAEAEDIKKEIELQNFEWSAGMKAALFDLYIKHEMLDEASHELSELQTKYKSFKIDAFKIIRYATVLVKNDKIDDAFSVVQKHNFGRTDNRLTQNCWELLNTISNSKNFANTKDMLDLLVAKEVCVITNKLLGPLVKGHLQRNDITSAVNIFMQCAQRYRMLPQKQEIVTALVKEHETYGAELKKVLNIIKNIHGKRESVLSLTLGLAECKDIRHLKHILDESGLSASCIIHGLQYYPTDKKLSMLLTILDADKNLPEIELLYEEILSIYNKLGDYENAIALWKRMNETAKPSQKFLTVFVNLLVYNKIPVPAEIRLNENKLNDILEKRYAKPPD